MTYPLKIKALPLLTALSVGSPSARFGRRHGVVYALFSVAVLEAVFKEEFASTSGKGVDRLNGFQFASNAKVNLAAASTKCMTGKYRFSPFLEVLKTKGRDKNPRLIGIPTVRDRVVLHQLNKFLATLYPERVPKNVASTYVREIAIDLKSKSPNGNLDLQH